MKQDRIQPEFSHEVKVSVIKARINAARKTYDQCKKATDKGKANAAFYQKLPSLKEAHKARLKAEIELVRETVGKLPALPTPSAIGGVE